MCESEATSKEHVPPKCLFPEGKDVGSNVDLRKQLITVPSCDLHNTQKSSHDAFLMYLLVVELKANHVATEMLYKKLERATKRNPSLYKSMFENSKDVVLGTMDSFIQSNEVPADINRINECFDHIARGIFYHETGSSWFQGITKVYDFIFDTNVKTAVENNRKNFEFGVMAKAALAHLPSAGENMKVFNYKFHRCKQDPFEAIAQFVFYESSTVTVAYVV
jgi:hypothetical protein